MPDQRAFYVRHEQDRAISVNILEHDEYHLLPLRDARIGVRWIADIGAHIGSFTRCAKLHWPAANVIAVEPAADNFPYFLLNTAGLTNVSLERVALVQRGAPRVVELLDAADGNPAARYVPRVIGQRFPSAAVRRVPATHIAALFKKYGLSVIDILKLDCEGAEVAILHDLSQSRYLNRVRFICGEWHRFDTIPRIAAALRETHDLKLFQGPCPWGMFFASLKNEHSPWSC